MRTGLTVRNIPQLPKYLWYLVKALFIFRKPERAIWHYLRESTPPNKSFLLRNGFAVTLSQHPHDLVTLFVVMVKEEYGRVRPGSVVVDIGANIGSYALKAAHDGAKKVYG